MTEEIAIKRHDGEKTSVAGGGDQCVEEDDLFSVGIAGEQDRAKYKLETQKRRAEFQWGGQVKCCLPTEQVSAELYSGGTLFESRAGNRLS